ncbi:mannitol dehydrogenase family protein [Microbacterium maritypicum]
MAVTAISYDRSQVTSGIVHFGVGNFHRSHQARYIDDLLRAPDTFELAKEWGICGVGVLPGDKRMRDALASQENVYTLVERGPDGTATARQIGSITEYLYGPEQLTEVLEKLADPSTRIVSLTITEGGYNISDSTGEFDTTNPAVLADVQNPDEPTTVFGLITAGLRLRRSRGIPAFTVMSCDNIEGNGDVARDSVIAFARLGDVELAQWIDTEVRFPNSMVDRITPVTSDDDRQWVESTFGVEDSWPVVSEEFTQWVLEDRFSAGRPPLESVGVQLVADVRPYELMKLRLLNASHQALAFTGLLAGYTFVHEAASDPVIAKFVRAYMDGEATPTLDGVPGVDLDQYKDSLNQRFASPYVRDTLARLATDASDRIPKFLVPVIRELREHHALAPLSALVIAAWARYAELVVAGADLPFNDRQQGRVRALAENLGADAVGYLHAKEWFGDLADDDQFVGNYLASLDALRNGDVRTVLVDASAR